MQYLIQTKNVNWLNTPKGTIWVLDNDPYMQPEDNDLIDNPLGVNVDLIDMKDWVWEVIPTIEIASEAP